MVNNGEREESKDKVDNILTLTQSPFLLEHPGPSSSHCHPVLKGIKATCTIHKIWILIVQCVFNSTCFPNIICHGLIRETYLDIHIERTVISI